ncbi:MAG: maleylpyruvate isomerase family mycothiol-dependent enzyme [Jatrophihabitans sp.]|nr:MAG: maleylpyruvate isomerase family mycothiol-dependent enzyme [Jatrophihabitans sp.]
MRAGALVEALSGDGPALLTAARRAGWEALVPGCPDWNVRDLVIHAGGVHRWAADVVRNARAGTDTDLAAEVGNGPSDAELPDWFADGHRDLVAVLRVAPDDLACAAFLPADSPKHFWARRQAHETAIHRADAEQAAGSVPSFAADFAQDGIAEVLLGFARRRSNAIAAPGRLALHAEDGPSWLVTFGGERIEAATSGAGVDGGGADATVSGTSSELYLWLWNRPSRAVVTGDAAVAQRWRGVRVRWG